MLLNQYVLKTVLEKLKVVLEFASTLKFSYSILKLHTDIINSNAIFKYPQKGSVC